MQRDGIQFHNVSECRANDGEGVVLQRVPERVRRSLNDGAQTRMRHPAGVELRFVPEERVELTLSTVSPGKESLVRLFWGPLQDPETFLVGPEPTTIELSVPERELRPEELEPLAYDPRVCRLLLPGEHRGAPIRYHGAEGDRRPPTSGELPEQRYLAYGTSITEGQAPVAEHLTYVNQTARRLGADPINLGSCGTAYCDAAMADHIARQQWDVATLALSVNMVDRFSTEEFRERASYMINTIADANPEPIACITIYPNARDVCVSEDEDGRCERFREALRDVVADAPEHVHLLEGPELLPDIGGLTSDLVHPGDNAMIRIGENLATELKTIR